MKALSTRHRDLGVERGRWDGRDRPTDLTAPNHDGCAPDAETLRDAYTPAHRRRVLHLNAIDCVPITDANVGRCGHFLLEGFALAGQARPPSR